MYGTAMVIRIIFTLLIYAQFGNASMISRTTTSQVHFKSFQSYSKSNNLIARHRKLNATSTLGQVESFRLINADTDLPIVTLVDGMIINLATQTTTNFNVQAIVANGTVGSVRFGYNDRNAFRIEQSPYALCGDANPIGNYFSCSNLTIGQHNVSATTFTGTRANGTAGITRRVSFRIVNISPTSAPASVPTFQPILASTHHPTRTPTTTPTRLPTLQPIHTLTKAPTRAPTIQLGQVESLRLINSDTDLPIIELVDGMIINLATQNTTNFNIQATIANGTVGSVRFGYNNRNAFRIEHTSEPYSLCGDGNPTGNYASCSNLTIGQHNISATTFTGNRANGTAGVTKRVSFRIVNIPPTSAPSATPSIDSAPSLSPSTSPSQAHTPVCKIPNFTDSSWTASTPDYPIDTSEPMGLIIGNDFVSFSGFINDFTSATNETYARDISKVNSTWRRMDDLPLSISFTHAPVVRVGMKVYMCGGYLGAHPGPHTAYCFVYDHAILPGTGQQWTRIHDLPNNGYAGGGMIYDTIRNTLYFAGGGQRLHPGNPHPVDFNRTFKYVLHNPSVGWVETTPIPYAANHLSSVTQIYGGIERHYFFGGQKAEHEAKRNLPNVYEFIASNETWVSRTFMPSGRGHTTASTRPIGCGFITAGGAVNSETTRKNRTNTILYYDIPTDSWTYIGNLSVAVATPLVDIYNSEYMYYINDRDTARRRIAV